MQKKKILVIEDELVTQRELMQVLTKENYEVIKSESGEEGIRLASVQFPDLILLDMMLPGIDGMETARRLKNEKKTSKIPIVVLSAKDDDFDIVAGLEAFAAVYITKPFKPRVLVARIRALLREAGDKEVSRNDSDIININDLIIDPNTFTVKRKGEKIILTKTEFNILYFLSRKPAWVFSREQIIRNVKGADYPVTESAIDMAIGRIRKKLGSAGEYIETVRGIGFKINKI